MCGILGLVANKNCPGIRKNLKNYSDELFRASEKRGRDSSGVAVISEAEIRIFKSSARPKKFIRTEEYKKLFADRDVFSFLGHTRLATNGSSFNNSNNQPVVKDGIVCVHNGIVVNVEELWKKFSGLKRTYEVDTEIIPSLIGKYLKEGDSIIAAVRKTFALIKGTASIAAVFSAYGKLLLFTNNGSLYWASDGRNGVIVFASEYLILKNFIRKSGLKLLKEERIKRCEPLEGLLIDIGALKIKKFVFSEEANSEKEKKDGEKKIIDFSEEQNIAEKTRGENYHKSVFSEMEKEYERVRGETASLRRCVKCVLPSSAPFINFDENGVCNFCRDYKKVEIGRLEDLEKKIIPYRKKGNKIDSLVMFSGGRDSSFGLHFVKKILGMNPAAYTYDWEMVADLARRNQARICGKLGIEQIIISADIRKKRENIRKNVNAWLKKPDLGIIPLFMAGDKAFFFYANSLKKKMNLDLIFQCSNPYEKTHFKYGFSNANPPAAAGKFNNMTKLSKIKIFNYYLKNFLGNPSYFNSSVLDSLKAYFSYYLIRHEYARPFLFYKWKEEEVNSVLMNEYDWETATDTRSTWRIGDGTAAFYNYIYFITAGFTENDTFRSNQIREGDISRSEALKRVETENAPRHDSIKWYCETNNIDMRAAVKIINKIEKKYKI